MASHILAIDAGTTGVTALVYDAGRTVMGRAYREFTQHYPKPGWVEHDAVEIWDVTLDVARLALQDAGVSAGDVAALGITNQRETTVVWDKRSGKPVQHALVWQDRRTAPECHALRKQEKPVRERTGLRIDPYFSATKIAWILGHVKGAAQRAAAGDLLFGTIDSWLAWNLTGGPDGGVHVTDVTNASRTLLWNIHHGIWDTALLELFEVPAAMLPDVVPSGHLVGVTQARLFGAAIPVASLVGDQQAALFGQGCTRAGEAKNTYGTGCFLLHHTGDTAVKSRNGLLTTRAASLDATARYALEGSVFIAGAAIQWLRDGLGTIPDAPSINDAAAQTHDTGGVVVVPAFAGLGAPYWDPDARGAVLGITGGTTAHHIARATLEGIALQAHDVLRAMEKDAKTKTARLRVDGGAAKSDLLMQIQADLLGRPVERPADVEATALGAALLAGITVGLWDEDDARRPAADVTTFKPRGKRAWVKEKEKRWKAAIKAVRGFS